MRWAPNTRAVSLSLLQRSKRRLEGSTSPRTAAQPPQPFLLRSESRDGKGPAPWSPRGSRCTRPGWASDRPAPRQPGNRALRGCSPSWAKRRDQPARGPSFGAPARGWGRGEGGRGGSGSPRLRVGPGRPGSRRPIAPRAPAHARVPASAPPAARLWLRPRDGPPEPPSAQPRPAGPGAAEPAAPCVCVRGAPSQPREDGGGGGGD